MPYRYRRISRLTSSSFQLAMLYMSVVAGTMLGLYFYSARIVSEINEMAGNPELMYESFLFAKLGPLFMLVMIAVAGLSFFISEFVTKRINTIQATAQNIMQTGDLSRRIPIENEWDDLSKMAMMLNEMLDQIQALMEDVRTVSDNIAHDMRTPLTRLQHHIELLERPITQSDSETRQMVIETLSQEAESLLATFNALLRISNIEKGKRCAELSSVSLSALLEDVLELYEPLAADKGQRFIVSLASVPPLMLDKHLIFQAAANLLDNAVKYTPSGGEIHVSLLPEQDAEVAFIIRDSGGGMSETALGKAFQRFYRGEDARSSQGSGLGLAMVKAVVELHKGTVRLANASGGLEARVALPLST